MYGQVSYTGIPNQPLYPQNQKVFRMHLSKDPITYKISDPRIRFAKHVHEVRV